MQTEALVDLEKPEQHNTPENAKSEAVDGDPKKQESKSRASWGGIFSRSKQIQQEKFQQKDKSDKKAGRPIPEESELKRKRGNAREKGKKEDKAEGDKADLEALQSKPHEEKDRGKIGSQRVRSHDFGKGDESQEESGKEENKERPDARKIEEASQLGLLTEQLQQKTLEVKRLQEQLALLKGQTHTSSSREDKELSRRRSIQGTNEMLKEANERLRKFLGDKSDAAGIGDGDADEPSFSSLSNIKYLTSVMETRQSSITDTMYQKLEKQTAALGGLVTQIMSHIAEVQQEAKKIKMGTGACTVNDSFEQLRKEVGSIKSALTTETHNGGSDGTKFYVLFFVLALLLAAARFWTLLSFDDHPPPVFS